MSAFNTRLLQFDFRMRISLNFDVEIDLRFYFGEERPLLSIPAHKSHIALSGYQFNWSFGRVTDRKSR
jgi:hypothetical protein